MLEIEQVISLSVCNTGDEDLHLVGICATEAGDRYDCCCVEAGDEEYLACWKKVVKTFTDEAEAEAYYRLCQQTLPIAEHFVKESEL